MRRIPILLAVAALATGCEKTSGNAPGDSPSPVVIADPERVVARVDGVSITIDDVEQLLREADAGLGRDEALEALIEQQLLAAEAERRGFGASGDVANERKRVLARLLLERLATVVTIDSLDRERLRKVYEAQLDRFVHGPQRRVVHAVALTGGGGDPGRARELIDRVHAVVREAGDEEAFRAALKPLLEQHGPRLRVEALPAFAADSKRFAKPFVDAAFAVARAGSVSKPFQTKFGWHVLLVVEDLPAAEMTFEEARPVIGADVLPAERKRHTEEFLRELHHKSDVFIHESNLHGRAGTDG